MCVSVCVAGESILSKGKRSHKSGRAQCIPGLEKCTVVGSAI